MSDTYCTLLTLMKHSVFYYILTSLLLLMDLRFYWTEREGKSWQDLVNYLSFLDQLSEDEDVFHTL